MAWAKGQQRAGGHGGLAVLHRVQPGAHAGQGLDALNQQPYQYGIVGNITPDSLAVAQKIGALAPNTQGGDGKPTKTVTIKKVTIAESPTSTAGALPPSS